MGCSNNGPERCADTDGKADGSDRGKLDIGNDGLKCPALITRSELAETVSD